MMLQDEARSGEWRKWTKVAIVVFFLFLAYEAIGFWWNHSVRSFTVLSESPSPSGRYKAVLFTCDCGVPCDLENSVSVLGRVDVADPDAGRVFRSFEGPASASPVPVAGGAFTYPDWTTVKWSRDDRLVVSYDRRAKVEEAIRATTVGLTFLGKRIRVDYFGR